jgi:hypothetical protein
VKRLQPIGIALRWLNEHGYKIGRRSSWDIENVLKPKLRIQRASRSVSSSESSSEISLHDERVERPNCDSIRKLLPDCRWHRLRWL